MNDDEMIDDQHALRWLDRLADGELNERSRGMLFEWLDRDPARWRCCALSLLESRELQSALAEWADEATTPVNGYEPDPLSKRNAEHRIPESSFRPSGRNLWRSLFSFAATVMIAFGLGIATDRHWKADAQLVDNGSKAKSEFPAQAGALKDSDFQQTIGQANASDNRDRANEYVNSQRLNSDPDSLDIGGEMAAIPDYVRGQFERYGYLVNSEQSVIAVTLPDGQQMAIPVEEWKFQYAGGRVY